MKEFPVCAPVIGRLEEELVLQAVRSGWVSSIGPFIREFEDQFASAMAAKNAVTVCNGTAAIHLTLHALGLGPGDEVILPDLTFAATAHAVLQTGATPVFADVDRRTWCIDPDAVEHAISPRTRAILPVHLYGHPADMARILAIAAARNLLVIEDAAEAHGATIGSKPVGALGNAGTFSFYGNKLITTGEGGMIVTNDDELAGRLRFLRDHGMDPVRRYYHSELAFNYRMTNVQAALGVAQLRQMETFVFAKRRIYADYRRALAGLELELNPTTPGCSSSFWMISAVLPNNGQADTQSLMSRLKVKGVDCRPFFVPMSKLPHLRDYKVFGAGGHPSCPVAEHLWSHGLNLPSSCSLTPEEVSEICGRIVIALENAD